MFHTIAMLFECPKSLVQYPFMPRHFTLLVCLFCVCGVAHSQNQTFSWKDESCEYISTYNPSKVTQTQLNNCYKLAFSQEFRLENTPSVFSTASINDLGLDSLTVEYQFKLQRLKTLCIPRSIFWEGLRSSSIKELKQVYELSRAAYLGYSDPAKLKQYVSEAPCLPKYRDAIIAGGDKLIAQWRELTALSAETNCCPEQVWASFNHELESKEKMQHARVYVMTFGWWNCANGYVDYIDKYYDFDTKNEEFCKLFVSTRTVLCDEN